MALLRALVELGGPNAGRLFVGHFDHHLRGEASHEDAAFVAELSQRLAIPCEIGRPNKPLRGGTGHVAEAVARRARYAFLEELAGRLGARFVATAHTADDQAETILHRILRGTGLAGLAGIPRTRPLGPATLIRPLLAVRRTQILNYLEAIGQDYRRDASNENLAYTRNRLRHELLPWAAEHVNPDAVEAVVRLGHLAAESRAAVADVVKALLERTVVEHSDKAAEIDAAALASHPRYLVREVLMALWRQMDWPRRAMGYREWDALATLLRSAGAGEPSSGPARVFPGGVSARCMGGRLRLERRLRRNPGRGG